MSHTFLSEVKRLGNDTHKPNIPNPQTPHESEGDVSDTRSAQCCSTSENLNAQENRSEETGVVTQPDSHPDDSAPTTESLGNADLGAAPMVEQVVQTSASVSDTIQHATPVQDVVVIGAEVTVVASSQSESLPDNATNNDSSPLKVSTPDTPESPLQKENRAGSFNTVDVTYAEAVPIEVIEPTSSTEFSSTEPQAAEIPTIETGAAKAIVLDNMPHEPSIVAEVTVPVQDELAEKFASVSAELGVTQQREHSLKDRVKDLEAQLCDHKDLVEQLRLDLEVIKTSKKELLEELAEAKRYILHLTEQHTEKQPPTHKQSPTHQKPASQSREASSKYAVPHQLSKIQARQPSHRTSTLPPPRPVAPASTRPSGLPPMSTEHLQGTPFKKLSAPNSKKPSTSKISSSMPRGIQRSPHRPLMPRDRPIPDVARDTHTKVPTPKLSDSDISWFD